MPATIGRLKFDQTGERVYETGVSNGVLYVYDESTSAAGDWKTGVAWNGLTSVSESPEGAEATAIYADNIKYLNLMSAEDFKGTIEAYTYPEEFEACDGSAKLKDTYAGVIVGQQKRTKFCLAYITKVGNDEDAEAGEKIHIVYNCLASPSERSYTTVNDSPEAITFSWEFSTTPMAVNVEGIKPTALITIDSTKFTGGTSNEKYVAIKDALYGKSTYEGNVETKVSDPTLLTPDAIFAILNAA